MQILLSSFWPTDECHIPAVPELVEANLDRTSPNRKNSDLISIFRKKNRRNSDFPTEIFLSSSAATAINILISIKGQKQQNRTLLVNLVNFRLESEKFRFHIFIEHSASRFASLPARSFQLAHTAPSSWGVALRCLRAIGAQVAARASASLLIFSNGGI